MYECMYGPVVFFLSLPHIFQVKNKNLLLSLFFLFFFV